jgi:hypothetical protein
VLQLVRGNTPYTIIIIAILTLALKLQALGHAIVPVADAHHALFGYIVFLLKHVLGNSATAFSLLAIVLTFAQAVYLMSIASRHRLFAKHTAVPAFAYIALSSLHPAFGQFSVQLLVNWFLLGALDTILHFTKREEPNRTIFNAGFLLGCALLLHFPAIVYWLLFILALLWLRAFKPGEAIVGLLGYITPLYFALCLLYLFNALPLVKSWPYWGNGLSIHPWRTAYNIGLLSGGAVLFFSGIFTLIRTFYKMPVSVRRGWGAIGTAMAVSIAVSALTPVAENTGWMNVLPPLALLIIPPMVGEARFERSKSSRFATFAFYLLLALVLFCQFALRH